MRLHILTISNARSVDIKLPWIQAVCVISRASVMSLTKWIWRLKCSLGWRPARVRARPALVVVVSGCDSGLGFQLARAARARGLTVVAGLLQGPQGPGGRTLGVAKDPHLHLVQLDVTSEESVDSLKDYVEKLLKDNPDYGLHAVVNNAGVMVLGEFEWQPSELWQHQLAVNVGGAMRLSRALLSALRASAQDGQGGAPRLITVGSHCAAQPLRGLAPYSASKAALAAWVEAIRPELKQYGVQVINFIPGLHAVVNNAGVMVLGEFEWQPSELWQHQLAVNVGGAMRLSRALLSALRASAQDGQGGAPRLITVGSHCAAQPLRGLAPYSASKAALAAWVEAIRPELKQYGVQVINFIPGRMVASTNLVTQQNVYTEKMRASLTPEQHNFYGEYFERYTRYVGQVGGESRDPDTLDDPTLEDMFAAALLEETPALQYKHEPLVYTLYYNLMRIAPLASLRYWFMEKLIDMPRYIAPERKSD